MALLTFLAYTKVSLNFGSSWCAVQGHVVPERPGIFHRADLVMAGENGTSEEREKELEFLRVKKMLRDDKISLIMLKAAAKSKGNICSACL